MEQTLKARRTAESSSNVKYIDYWKGHYNLGDAFSDYLFDKMYDRRKLDQVSDRKKMRFIGSETPSWANDTCLICGLGWHYRNVTQFKSNPPSDCFKYVRGKICRQRILDAGVQIPKDLPIGDTGLLASLLYQPKSEKKWDLGIITHWSGAQHIDKYLQSAREKFPDKKIRAIQMGDLNMECQDLFEFIQSCRTIVASSLHAIIFSHSFGVPAVFFSNVDGFKFQDYYSVYDRIEYPELEARVKFEDAICHVFDEQFIAARNPTLEEVRQIQKDILFAMPYRQCFSSIGNNIINEFETTSLKKDEQRTDCREAFFVQNRNHCLLMESSSGGVVPEIIDLIRSQGGYCFGVAFSDDFMSLKYVEVDDSNENKVLGSKYVDVCLSDENKKRILELLGSGKRVLFIGRPCQCHWMRNEYGKYPNLVLVELMCYGVPEDSLWKDYIGALIKEHGQIKSINFRDKSIGWKQYGMRIEFMSGEVLFEQHNQNAYMRKYLSDKYLKKKCANCVFGNEVPSSADIVCGDAWGVEKFLKDNRGASIVIANTDAGKDIFGQLREKFNMTRTSLAELDKVKNCNRGLKTQLKCVDSSRNANPKVESIDKQKQNGLDRKSIFYFMQNLDDEVLKNSSAGGFVPAVVDYALSQGWMCLGAAFDSDFMGLHYVEVKSNNKSSVMGSKYIDVMLSSEQKWKMETELRAGRKVMFIGRPCQCNWLRNRFPSSNLILVEVCCSGVPQKDLWKDYVSALKEIHGEIESINFRNRVAGGKECQFNVKFKNGKTISEPYESNSFMQEYLNSENLRVKCQACQFGKAFLSSSDLICGDAQGVGKLTTNNMGVSIVATNTQMGIDIFNAIKSKFRCANADATDIFTIKQHNKGNKIYISSQQMAAKSWNFDVVVSFATHKDRMNKPDIYQFLDRIVNQEYNGKYHIVANIWRPDYESAPQKLKDYFKEHDIEVILSDINYRTFLKNYYVFQKYGGLPIITFDDDQLYRKDAIQLCMDTNRRHPGIIVGGFCIVTKRKPNGEIIKPRPLPGTPPVVGMYSTGSGGALYPPEFIATIQRKDMDNWLNVNDVPKKYDDDMFLNRWSRNHGFPTMVVECSHKKQTWRGYLVEKFLSVADDETAKSWRKEL